MSAQDSLPALAPRSSQDVVVDRLRWWDLDEVQELERQLFAADPWTAGQFWSELARVPESRWYVVARRGSRIVGYAGVFVVGPEADVQTVAVALGERGRGTGRALLGRAGRPGPRAGGHRPAPGGPGRQRSGDRALHARWASPRTVVGVTTTAAGTMRC